VFAVAVSLFCYFKPSYGPKASHADTSWKAKIIAIKRIWGVVVLFGLVLGAIYAGWTTPDEAAAIGVVGSFLLVLFGGNSNGVASKKRSSTAQKPRQ